jgi:hypothetical protein
MCRIRQRRKPAPWVLDDTHRSVDRLALFHYATRSREDFAIKQTRGGGNTRVGKSWSYFDILSRCASGTPCLRVVLSHCLECRPPRGLTLLICDVTVTALDEWRC